MRKDAATFGPLFHGTSSKFEVFRTRRTQYPGGGMSLGAYFTENPEVAKKFMHGPNATMKKVTLELNKPLDLRGIEYEQLPETLPWLNQSAKLLCGRSHAGMYQVLEYLNKYYGLVPTLKKRGYDGIIFDDDVEGTTYVAFRPDQIEVMAGVEDEIAVTTAPDGRITAKHPLGVAMGLLEDTAGLAKWLYDNRLQEKEAEKYAKAFILAHISVRGDQRRKGVGRALVGALLDAAKAQGAQVCFLLAQSLTGLSSKELAVFYSGLGFEPVQRNIFVRKLAGIPKFAAMNTISLQDAQDKKFFGPVYHGTTEERQENIGNEGFKVYIGDAGSGDVSHGYEGTTPYHEGIPAPVHHLGYGIYFTTAKSIAKTFAGGTTRGMKTYYLDVPRLETINFGAPKNMMKWWIANGYDPELATGWTGFKSLNQGFTGGGGKKDRIAATEKLTENLKSKWDAVWFKGKGMYRLLDGDQIVVFDPNRIYQVDPALAKPGDVGSKVVRKADGMKGTITKRENIEGILEQYPAAASWVKPGAKFRYSVRWTKGGTDYNTQDVDIDLVGVPKVQGATASAKVGWTNEDGKKVKTNPKNKIRNLTFEVEDYAPAGYNEGYLVQAWTPSRLPNPYSPEERPVGQLDVIIDEFAASGKQPYVFDIGVEDDWRGTGLGQALYDRAIAEAKKRGYTEFNSSTDRNPDSQAAWGRLSKRYPVEQKHDPKMKWETWDSIDLTASVKRASAEVKTGWITPEGKNLPLEAGETHGQAAVRYKLGDPEFDVNSRDYHQTAHERGNIRVNIRTSGGGFADFEAQHNDSKTMDRIGDAIGRLPAFVRNIRVETWDPHKLWTGLIEEAWEKFPYYVSNKTAEVDDGGFNEEGFWAGEGNAASGVLLICPTTGRIGLAWRSPDVHIGDCWGVVGGAVKKGMTPQESAKEELGEEIGYGGGITLHPAFVFRAG